MPRKRISRRRFLKGLAAAAAAAAAPAIWLPRRELFAQAAPTPAFIGAQGFGALTSHARSASAKILFVTNLNDSGPGSFRAALTTPGPRYIIFRVAGYIEVLSKLNQEGEANGYCYIAGQSAPGDGITFRNGVNDPGSVANLWLRERQTCIRFIRARNRMSVPNRQCLTAFRFGRTPAVDHLMIDHCSFSWATDDQVFIAWDLATMQWCITGETNGKSTMFNTFSTGPRVSLHHNFWHSGMQRNPMIASGSAQVINNLVYNWGGRVGLAAEYYNLFHTPEPGMIADVINNYFKWGPSTQYGTEADGENGWEIRQGGDKDSAPAPGSLFLSGNKALLPSAGFINARVKATSSPGFPMAGSRQLVPPIPIAEQDIATQAQAEAFATFLFSKVGCLRPRRDGVDQALINSYSAYTGFAINSETESLYARANGGQPWQALDPGTPDHLEPSGMTQEFITRMGLQNTTVSALSTSISQARGLGEQFQNIEWNLMEKAGDIAPLAASGGGGTPPPAPSTPQRPRNLRKKP